MKLVKVRELNSDKARTTSASGLVFYNSHFYVASDDVNFLCRFSLDGPLEKITLDPRALPEEKKARKKAKKDFEAICIWKDSSGVESLFVLPSGSKPQRSQGFLLTQHRDRSDIIPIDLSGLFDLIRNETGKLNLEGACMTPQGFKLFQRGNKGDGRNAVINLNIQAFEKFLADGTLTGLIESVRFPELGEFNGLPLTFTDACYFEGRSYFLAAAEDTSDSYVDGPCSGSFLGILDESDHSLSLEPLEPSMKAEGLSIVRDDSGVHFYFVNDEDDASIVSHLWRASKTTKDLT